ncbi:LLM class flavin-dependent oxidoreductase [Kouleothrix sp.]|uniref:LLM class flavin-dependent oxidoreductase n=1 Tax=Kouleothrix sp. TaxID=2779161 RepID=UPI00391BE20E
MVLSDVWLMLAAVALRTASLRLRTYGDAAAARPWKLAREVATLDRLSRGRLTLGVGIGAGDEYNGFGEPGDDRAHGEMLDEACAFRPAQRRAFELHRRTLPRRECALSAAAGPAARADLGGRRVAGQKAVPPRRRLGWRVSDQAWPARDRADTARGSARVAEYVRSQRPAERQAQPYDLVHAGITAGRDAAADRDLAEQYAAAGVTWWLENFNNDRGPIEEQRARIRKGPPRLS